MSDIGTDDKPWNLISDSRVHRCVMPELARIGRRFECPCGTVFLYRDTPFGRQWMPDEGEGP